MILVDTNIFFHASNSTVELHAESHNWLDEKLNGTARVGLSWPSLLAFLHIATNPRVVRSPLTIRVAWEQVSSWPSAESVWAPEPAWTESLYLSRLTRRTCVAVYDRTVAAKLETGPVHELETLAALVPALAALRVVLV